MSEARLLEDLQYAANLGAKLEISKEEFLRAVRDGVRDAMPQLYEERIYEIIGEAVSAGIKEYLSKRR